VAEAPQSSRHRAAVLGSPIEHSLSPLLHRAAYADLGLDWQYDAIEVDEHTLKDFLAGLDDSWAGLSLTMPLKERVISYLDVVDDLAAEIRSVNTVIPSAGGWRGTNTDVVGMVRALREAGVHGELKYGTVLGSGATARSAVASMAELGVEIVTVHARNSETSRAVAELAIRLGVEGRTTDLQPDLRALEADVVISTLPGDAAEPWVRFADGARGTLLDVSYHPWPTPLAATWRTRSVASGRDLLLWQAVEQVRLMTGREPSPVVMAAALPA
jgi:shikimate dehydrogenase